MCQVDTGSSQFWAASESCPDCKTGNMTIPPLSGYAGCDNGTLYYGKLFGRGSTAGLAE
jgi:hypothetical protein